MSKTANVKARLEPQTKALAGKLLKAHGLTHSAFINMSYHRLINGGGIPTSLNVPNAELAQDLEQDQSAKGKRATRLYKGSTHDVLGDILGS